MNTELRKKQNLVNIREKNSSKWTIQGWEKP